MSLVRWGSDGSDVYIYWTIDTDRWHCSCKEDFETKENKILSDHLRKHVEKDGYHVPQRVFDSLREND